MSGLQLAERIVAAAEEAIEDQAEAEDTYANRLGTKVYGFVADFARYGAVAVIDALAADLAGKRCCPIDAAVCCSYCAVLETQIKFFAFLTVEVRNVPALEAV